MNSLKGLLFYKSQQHRKTILTTHCNCFYASSQPITWVINSLSQHLHFICNVFLFLAHSMFSLTEAVRDLSARVMVVPLKTLSTDAHPKQPTSVTQVEIIRTGLDF